MRMFAKYFSSYMQDKEPLIWFQVQALTLRKPAHHPTLPAAWKCEKGVDQKTC